MLVRDVIPSLIQGVSQQPPAQRLPTHCDLADNCFLSPSDGLTKRPPTTFYSPLFPSSFPDHAYCHWINRNETERYLMFFQSGSVNVFDLLGNPYVVVRAGGTADYSYLTCPFPDQQIKALTIADTTYVVNTTKKVAMTGAGTGTLHWKTTLLWVRTAVLGGTYNVNLDGIAAAYAAPTTGTVTTDSIATGLASAMNTALTGHSPGYTVVTGGSVIMVTRNDASDFQSLSLVDSQGGSAMTAVTNTVQRFSDLPSTAPNMVVKVQPGDPNQGVPTAAGGYYVQFQQKTPSPTSSALWYGLWQECPGPSQTSNAFDATTMPYQLVRLQDDGLGTVTGTPNSLYFQYGPVTWGNRVCGDSTLVPDPSFVGNTINELFLYRGRMGFLSDTKVILSQVDNFVNFWRTTMLTVLDTDPIDISAAHPRVVTLRHAVPFNKDLIILGDLVQMVLSSTDTLTPSNVSLLATTEYEADLYCKPIPIANMMYLPYRIQNYGAVREYYVEYYTQRHVGKSITDHVPKYLNGNITKLAHCVSSDMLVALTDNDQGSIYVYKFAWQGNSLYTTEKLQSAWSRWNFDLPNTQTRIYSVYFVGQQMFMVVGRAVGGVNTVSLETLIADSLPNDSTANGQPWVAYVDRRVVNTAIGGASHPQNAVVATNYLSPSNTTVFTLPYKLIPGANMVVFGQGTGVIYPIVATGVNTVTVNGNLTNVPVWIGNNYTMRYRFSPVFVREQATTAQNVPVLTGRLQLRTFSVRFVSTGYFRFEITPAFRDLNSVPFSGNRLGSAQNLLGNVPLVSDSMRVLVGSRNDQVQIDLVNDTPFPSRFSNAEWEGLYYSRARRT